MAPPATLSMLLRLSQERDSAIQTRQWTEKNTHNDGFALSSKPTAWPLLFCADRVGISESPVLERVSSSADLRRCVHNGERMRFLMPYPQEVERQN